MFVRVDSGQRACQKRETLGQRLPVLMDPQSDWHVKRTMGMMEGGQAAVGTSSVLHEIAEGEQFASGKVYCNWRQNYEQLEQEDSVQEEVSFSGMWGRRLHLESVICMHLEAFLILFLPLASSAAVQDFWAMHSHTHCGSLLIAHRSLKYLHPIVTLERWDALCIKELYRHSWKFYQCLKYRSSLIHKKNDSSLLRVEYSMCWERGGFWYILQTVSCSLSTFPNKKIYSYLLHMYTLPQIFSEHLSHSL